VDALLAKLRSVDALSEEEYRAALAEEIVVRGRGEPAAPTVGAGDSGAPPPTGAAGPGGG
jgi:hypothetical protein